ncbi:hypothetical protein NEIMUCOT_04262 [Neisseria mucosa ATCC 25996]|uniref:Uncharacterized protein n=1 Tax=Neisseria mucosa (strain ATCC 25996 / DSM 4631 / NCTC 10774 / M26) TaxID=546266 RepID=D2ZUH5_NEIM2|nr:hypothetical protein NEIMUCOT_04262 [Neisseria mucosa ATCC 25996]
MEVFLWKYESWQIQNLGLIVTFLQSFLKYFFIPSNPESK